MTAILAALESLTPYLRAQLESVYAEGYQHGRRHCKETARRLRELEERERDLQFQVDRLLAERDHGR